MSIPSPDKRYHSYNDHMRSLFGCRVYKASIDGGFTCPNRDGTKGFGGCIFCDASGSSSRTQDPETDIATQVRRNINFRRSRYRAKKFIAYFQSFTNTYAPVEELRRRYDAAIAVDEDIVGLTISTRPDCLDAATLDLIASYKERLPYVSIEFGMQTIHDTTLTAINRCQTHEDFLRAYEMVRSRDISHCVHVILGLPGESRDDMLATAECLYDLDVEGVKIHLLVAMEETPLATMYHDGLWTPLSFEEYIPLVCDFIERLPEKCILHRVSGNGHPLHVVAPTWVYKQKKAVMEAITAELSHRGTRQGTYHGRH
jgi:uncharacterized protein